MGFFDDFFGITQREDITAAHNAAGKAIEKGRQEYDQRADEAFGMFTPYAQQGQQANAMYGHAIGLGTDQQRSAAQDRYFSDPAFSQITSNQQNAMLRNLNARGISGSGAAIEAGSRIAYDNYGNWLDRLNNAGQQGFQATGAQAGIRSAQGQLAYDHGITDAGRQINYGNAMAESRGIGLNNLLQVASTAAKFIPKPMPMPGG